MASSDPPSGYVSIDLTDPKNQIYLELRDGLQKLMPQTLKYPKELTDRLKGFGVTPAINGTIEAVIASLGIAYVTALGPFSLADPQASKDTLRSRLGWEVIWANAYTSYVNVNPTLKDAIDRATEEIDLETIAPGLSEALDIDSIAQLYALESAKRWLGIEPKP